MKHSVFLVQLLMDEVDLGESTRGQVPGAKPSPNNMPVSWYDVQDLQQVLWAKAEGIERRTRLDLLKRTRKMSIWSEKDDEEMPLPLYSLHYAEQGCQDWEEELAPE